MLTIGLASYALSDTGQTRAREQREREIALNLAEAVLYSQGFALASTWPGNADGRRRDADDLHLGDGRDHLPRSRGRSPSANAAGADVGELHERRRRREHDLDDAHPRQRRADRRRVRALAGRRGAERHERQDRRRVHAARARASGTPTATSCCGCRRARSCAGRPRNIVALLRARAVRRGVRRRQHGDRRAASRRRTPATRRSSTRRARRSSCAARPTAPSCTDYDANKSQVLPPAIIRDPGTPPAMTAAQIARFKARGAEREPADVLHVLPSRR